MLGLLGIALCQLLGHAAGDKISRDCSAGSSGHKVAIGVGIVSLWLMNVSVNVLMGPARAIINDLVEATFLVRANSIATGAMGTLCYLLSCAADYYSKALERSTTDMPTSCY